MLPWGPEGTDNTSEIKLMKGEHAEPALCLACSIAPAQAEAPRMLPVSHHVLFESSVIADRY